MPSVIDGSVYRDGKKIGWTDGHSVYDESGNTVAYLDDNKIRTADGEREIDMEENRRKIRGDGLSDAARAAVRLLLGD